MTAAEWVRVESPTSLDWIDGFLHSGSTEIDPLPIQVTKAYPAIWGELPRNPSGVSKNRDVNEIRQTLMEAIEKKKAHADPKVVLALEAVHSPVAKLAVDKFIETAQNKARAIGFKEIWLVGPTCIPYAQTNVIESILPILHGISIEQIRLHSPILTDRVAAKSSEGV